MEQHPSEHRLNQAEAKRAKLGQIASDQPKAAAETDQTLHFVYFV